ncbi:MAG TPA: hypothetical protein VEK56_01755 [Vicinamibacterales bacterium]|nr:hypothetical protein [Vicinamibacterales bacterium]
MTEQSAARPGTRAAAGSTQRLRAGTIVLLVVGYLAAFTVVADMRVHRAVQDQLGVNIWGYRGPIARQTKVEDRRVVMLGNDLVFGGGLVYEQTVPAYLQRNLNQKWRRGFAGLIATVVSLAGPTDVAESYLMTLRDYRRLGGDVVCMFTTADYAAKLDSMPAVARRSVEPWRHRSVLFRWTGYYPLLPAIARRGLSGASVAATPAVEVMSSSRRLDGAGCDGAARGYCDAVLQTVDYVLNAGRRVLIVRPPFTSEAENDLQDALANRVHDRFGTRVDIRSFDLGRDDELAQWGRGSNPRVTAHETDRIADLLTTPLLELMR